MNHKTMNHKNMNIKINEFPHDFFIPLEGDPYHLGRLTLNSMVESGGQPYNVEIDIVEKESKKFITMWTYFMALMRLMKQLIDLCKSCQTLSKTSVRLCNKSCY